MHKFISFSLVMLCASGCIPMTKEVTAGHKYTKEEIAFLDLPKTTREEVISTLGEPLMEVSSSRVLLYTWETTPRSLIPHFDMKNSGANGGSHLEVDPHVEKGDQRDWGLFIAYDERGYVTAHEVRKVGTAGLDQDCIEWRQQQTQNEP